MSKPRVKAPRKPVAAGSIVNIKCMLKHKMETGLRKDKKTGKPIPRKIINHFTATLGGKTVLDITLHPSVSANPYFAFKMKPMASGDLVLTFTEDGGKTFTAKKKITVA